MKSWKVRYSYLPQQFKNTGQLWNKLKKFVPSGDFTLGKELSIFEKNFSKLIGTRYAVGVNSGTDSLKLILPPGNSHPRILCFTIIHDELDSSGPGC